MPWQLTGGVAWRWRSILSHLESGQAGTWQEEEPRQRELQLLSFHLRGRCGLSRLVTGGAHVQESPVGAQTWPWLLLWLQCTHLGCSHRWSARARHLFLLAQPPHRRLALTWLICLPLFLSPVHDNHSSEESLPKDVHWAHRQPFGVSAIQTNSHSESTKCGERSMKILPGQYRWEKTSVNYRKFWQNNTW